MTLTIASDFFLDNVVTRQFLNAHSYTPQYSGEILVIFCDMNLQTKRISVFLTGSAHQPTKHLVICRNVTFFSAYCQNELLVSTITVAFSYCNYKSSYTYDRFCYGLCNCKALVFVCFHVFCSTAGFVFMVNK